MPPPRPPNYPLDVDPRFTTQKMQAIGAGFKASGQSVGVLHEGDGDLRTWVAVEHVKGALKDLYTVHAYLAFADDKADRLVEGQDAIRQSVGALAVQVDQRMNALQARIDTVAAHVAQIAAMLGSVIPDWQTRTEVENGDDMGLERPSAAERELLVDYVILQREPGYSHEQVVWIEPAPGTMVRKGSTVRVAISLEG